MEHSDLKLLASIMQVSGFLCIAFGLIAYFYEERRFLGYWVVYPYSDYAFPLVVLGIILVVVGAMVHDHAQKKEEEIQQNQKN